MFVNTKSFLKRSFTNRMKIKIMNFSVALFIHPSARKNDVRMLIGIHRSLFFLRKIKFPKEVEGLKQTKDIPKSFCRSCFSVENLESDNTIRFLLNRNVTFSRPQGKNLLWLLLVTKGFNNWQAFGYEFRIEHLALYFSDLFIKGFRPNITFGVETAVSTKTSTFCK